MPATHPYRRTDSRKSQACKGEQRADARSSCCSTPASSTPSLVPGARDTRDSHRELEGIAAAGAAVCVSITTEANLGDGFFDTEPLL